MHTIHSERTTILPESPQDLIEPGDFSFIRDPLTRMFLHDAYQAVSMADAWVSLRSESPTTDRIQNYMRYSNDHSGASYALTMRSMETIAKKGWETFVRLIQSSQNHS